MYGTILTRESRNWLVAISFLDYTHRPSVRPTDRRATMVSEDLPRIPIFLYFEFHFFFLFPATTGPRERIQNIHIPSAYIVAMI